MTDNGCGCPQQPNVSAHNAVRTVEGYVIVNR